MLEEPRFRYRANLPMIGARLGNWIIDAEIGQGGMGTVYLVHPAPSQVDALANGKHQAALKVLGAALAQDAGFVHRFQREIDILRQLDHPNIVRFYESGAQDNYFFYVMEHVRGRNFEELLQERRQLPWPLVLDTALQVCLALKHAHDRGIIHRDLKPSNLLLQTASSGPRSAVSEKTPAEVYALVQDASSPPEAKGVVKLTDFGIAKVFATPHLTATGGVVGTAEYLSPEQAVGKPVSKRSDLYSLGVVLYALLTGRTPFQGEGIVDLLHKHRFAQFERPSRLVADLPHDLEEVVCQLLEKDPDRRPADAMVLHRRLDSVRRKLERKSRHTMSGKGGEATQMASLAVEAPPERPPGPATLMSRLMRQELEQQNRGGILWRLLNQPIVLVPLFLLCLGVIVWGVWPLSDETRFRRGAALMASEDPDDWEAAWEKYLEPLSQKSDNPHRDEVERFRQRAQGAKMVRLADIKARRAGPISEAEWFFDEGLRRAQRGDREGAERLWRNLIQSFRDVPAEKPWVLLAEKQLKKPSENILAIEERWQSVHAALQRARQLREDGQAPEAEEIYQGLEELYRADPSAAGILEEVRRERAR
jgi:serine/threonine protein kinase